MLNLSSIYDSYTKQIIFSTFFGIKCDVNKYIFCVCVKFRSL